jgi:hypothetical protein
VATRRLTFAWVGFALGLASCVSLEELRRADEATCAVMAFAPAPTPSLPVSSGRAWRGVTGLRRHRHRTGDTGAIGGDGGARIGPDGRV